MAGRIEYFVSENVMYHIKILKHKLFSFLQLKPCKSTSWSTAPDEGLKINRGTVMDFSDGDVFVATLPSNFTAIKEKTPTQANERAVSINGETTNLDNDKLKSGIIEDITEVGKSIKTDIFHEISDSGSENETPQILGEEYPKLRKSSKPSDSVSLSKKSMRNIIPFRAPSPDSDSELLVPAFGDHEGESYTKTTTMKNYSGSSVVEKYAISTHSDYDVGPTYSAEKDLFIEGNCANDGNNCSKESVKKKKRSRIEIEEERKAALVCFLYKIV